MKKWVRLFAILLFMSSIIEGAYLSPITDMGTSARTVALGQVEGLHSGAERIFESPTPIKSLSGARYGMFHVKLADQESGYFCFSTVMRAGGAQIGFGIASLSIPNIDLTGLDSGNKIIAVNTIQVNERMVKAGIAYPLFDDHLGIGGSVHYYEQNLYTVVGKGVNTDVGITLMFDEFDLSLTGKNLLWFSKMSYGDGASLLDFPARLQLSGRVSVFSHLNLFSQGLYDFSNGHVLKSLGVEYMPIFLEDYFRLYGGWGETSIGSLVKSRYSVGIGLNLSALDIQFYYQLTDYVLNNSQYGISVNLEL